MEALIFLFTVLTVGVILLILYFLINTIYTMITVKYKIVRITKPKNISKEIWSIILDK